MNSKQYEAWKKSRQIKASDFDIAGTVMEQIIRKTCRQGYLRTLWNSILVNLIQAKSFVRVCVLASGALAGLLRMMFAFYYALFA